MSLQGGGSAPLPPGLSSDGSDGITVPGAITAGTAAANGGLFPDYSQITGNLALRDAAGNNPDGDEVLVITQDHGLSTDMHVGTVYILRRSVLNGHICDAPVVSVIDQSHATANIMELTGSLGAVIRFGQAGGIGLFNTTPPVAPRTLAQATINAIVDTNAKAAVQACANALSDIGILTLT